MSMSQRLQRCAPAGSIQPLHDTNPRGLLRRHAAWTRSAGSHRTLRRTVRLRAATSEAPSGTGSLEQSACDAASMCSVVSAAIHLRAVQGDSGTKCLAHALAVNYHAHLRLPREKRSAAEHPLFVSFAGGGIYFFWQLGAVRYLRTRYDLTQLPMAGASSGSLVACLSACGVDPQLSVDSAYQLAVDNDIWNRKLGLLGIWGGLIRKWLDELLPDNAHELVHGRLRVIIARAPTLSLFEGEVARPVGFRSCATAPIQLRHCTLGLEGCIPYARAFHRAES